MIVSGLTDFGVELSNKRIQNRIDYYQEKINQWDLIFSHPNDFGVTKDDVLLREDWVKIVTDLKNSLKF